jgi:carboxypeptidase Q
VRSAAPFLVAFSISSPAAAAAAVDAERLVAALMGSTPLVEDLRSLTDEIGGRPTGSAANERSIEWGLARFRAMGVDARRESFPMPARWLERSARATVRGPVSFSPAVAAMPFSMTTAGTTARLLDAGKGTEADFARLGSSVRGAFLLVETEELADLDGLFREYAEAAGAEKRAAAADAAGVVYMGSRPRNLLYRHTAARGAKNDRLLLIMEREGAQRALRLVRAGHALDLAVEIDAERGGGYESANVVGEIRGTEKPEEIVLLGAHLDSWDLGTGALDNGCNVTLVLDVARQVKTLGLRPRRTLRFVLWNGEEQGLVGSLGYVKRHAAELDRHVATVTLDIGSGRLTGFFTGGRPELEPVLARVLKPVEGLGAVRALERADRRHRQLRLHDRGRRQPRGEPGLRQLRAELPRALRHFRQGRSTTGPLERGGGGSRPLGPRRGGRHLEAPDGRRGGGARERNEPQGPDDVVRPLGELDGREPAPEALTGG